MHTADVKNVLRVFSIEVAAREKDDLKEEPIVIRLRKVSAYIFKVSRLLIEYSRLAARAMMEYSSP